VITGEEDLRPEIRILLQLLGDEPPPRAWLRAGTPSPLQRLLGQDFAGFEDALDEYRRSGFVIRKRGEACRLASFPSDPSPQGEGRLSRPGPGASRPATHP
jgi:hypothetical protein